jgi:hypothetical protein
MIFLSTKDRHVVLWEMLWERQTFQKPFVKFFLFERILAFPYAFLPWRGTSSSELGMYSSSLSSIELMSIFFFSFSSYCLQV